MRVAELAESYHRHSSTDCDLVTMMGERMPSTILTESEMENSEKEICQECFPDLAG